MLAKSFLSIVTATAFYCKVSDRGDYTRLYQVLGAWLVAFICRFFWYEYLSNPLSSIPRIQSDWQTRVYRWMYTEPTPIQLREWVKASPNDGLLRYYGIGGSPRLLLTNAEAVKEAFVTQQYSQFEKPELIRLRTGNNIGFGLSATTGKVHRTQRRKMMPALNPTTSRSFSPAFLEKTRKLVQAINKFLIESSAEDVSDKSNRPSGLIDISRWASCVTIDSVGDCVFGRSLNTVDDPNVPFYDNYRMLAEISMSATKIVTLGLIIPMTVLARLPLQVNKDQRRAIIASRTLCVETIKEHRDHEDLEGRKDVLSLAMRSGMFDDEELTNHMGNLLGAGHETTAFQIAFTCYFLAKYPEVQGRLRAEVKSAIPNQGDEREADAKWIEDVPYLVAVVNESLRLLPAATGIYRTAEQDTQILGHRIPAGTTVAAFGLVNHYLESNWGSEAGRFSPERWMRPGQEQLGGAKSPYDLISFSLGPRRCPGADFAKQEVLAVMAGLVDSFQLDLTDPDFEPRFRYNISLAPAGGLNLRFTSMDGRRAEE